MARSVEIRVETPDPAVFCAWRERLGWGALTEADAIESLAASWASVVAMDGGALVGFGRIVGDGVLYYYIQDLIVAENRRGEGIGDLLLKALLDEIRRRRRGPATVGLLSALGMEPFYERHGFVARPNTDYGAGMILVLA